MIDKIIRRVIRAAIKSFPIDEKKKTELLWNVLGESPEEDENDVL